MTKIAIIYKGNSSAAKQHAEHLRRWVFQRGGQAQLQEAATRSEPHKAMEPLDSDISLLVVLGGDGTMLGAIRGLMAKGLAHIPVVGVNLGGLGFLTALSPDELLPAMDRVLARDYSAPPRLMLELTINRNGIDMGPWLALNDVVINKLPSAPLVELPLMADGVALTTFRADGLVVATPTGSTAYSLSAGGPICHPAMDSILVTPICSFSLSNRPLLLTADTVLSLSLIDKSKDSIVTCDGQVDFLLAPGDVLTIRQSEHRARLILSPFRDYYEIIRTKLGWR